MRLGGSLAEFGPRVRLELFEGVSVAAECADAGESSSSGVPKRGERTFAVLNLAEDTTCVRVESSAAGG